MLHVSMCLYSLKVQCVGFSDKSHLNIPRPLPCLSGLGYRRKWQTSLPLLI